MAVFKRAWRLQIQIGDKIKTYQELNYDDTSLKIEFDVTNGIYGVFASGNITIYNLNLDDMQYLASCTNPYGRFKRNKISLEAGYVNSLGVILSGNIIEADADFTSPDNRITFKITGSIGNNLTNNSIQTSLNGAVDFKTICNECAKKNGLKLKYDNKLKKRFLQDFSFLGTPFQMIEQLRSYFDDLNIFIDETGSLLNVLLKEDGEEINKQVLSKDTGLIGKPKPTMLGVNVVSMLNINLRAGGHVKLKNERLTQFDGVYRIQELKHRGSNMSDDWISELTMQRVKNG
ncbi:TPA: hypothetical protein ACGTOP_001924 [Campylobacter coli]